MDAGVISRLAPKRDWLPPRCGPQPGGSIGVGRRVLPSVTWKTKVVDDSIDIEINESDVRTDTFRSSGAGGQHVNTTDSAIRLTHIPTGVVVQCQNDRSQHKNRAEAWKMLRARLYEVELEKREAEAMAEAASKTAIGWGHQIRSYVLQPYQLVKDHRTKEQVGDVSRVLDGDIDVFIKSYLMKKSNGMLGEPVVEEDD